MRFDRWRLIGCLIAFVGGPLLWLAIGALFLAGCGPSARDKAIANSAATIYEAAAAIEQGAPVAAPAAAIKANASAIATATGHVYPAPPAEGARP